MQKCCHCWKDSSGSCICRWLRHG